MQQFYAHLSDIPIFLRRICVICCLFPAMLQAQVSCDFQKLFGEGKAAAERENYEIALKKFNSARRCDPNKGQEIDREIENLYEAINKKKEQAELEKQRAEEEKKKADAARKESEKNERIARAALDSLQKANADKVRLLLAEAERHQKELDYNAALDKLNTARFLFALSDSVDLAYKNLSSALLYHSRKDLRRMDYQSALKKIKIAEKLNIQPDSVKIAIQELQHFLFENARLDILNTKYDAALEKINVVHTLRTSPDSVEHVWFELAFCSVETGHLGRSTGLLDSIARMHNNDAVRAQLRELDEKNPAEQARLLRQMMQQLDPERYNHLLNRYFPPVFGKIPGGMLVMGSDEGDEAPGTCPVAISPFELGTREVTFFEFDLFCAATQHRKPSDHDWGRGQRPVVDVEWYDALEYCNWRSRQEGLQEVYKIDTSSGNPVAGTRKCWPVSIDESANGYRLPTEAEWEFAAGNGEKHTRYSWGDASPTVEKGGNVADETAKTLFPDWHIFQGYSDSFAHTSPTGSFSPNVFGLYDMTGNVWEWCWDGYAEDYCRNYKKKGKDPYNGCRVLRGGSWGSFQQDCSVRRRFYNTADTRNFSIGFRLAKNQVTATR